MIDNVLVHGKTLQEHDQRLVAVLDRLRKVKVRKNVSFLSTVFDSWGKSSISQAFVPTPKGKSNPGHESARECH